MKLNNNATRFVSTRKRILILITSLILLLLVMLWLFNTLFLSIVYRREKVEDMEEVFASLDEASIAGALYDSRYDKTFEKLSADNNLDIVVVSSNGVVILTSGREKHNTVSRLLDALLANREGKESIVHNDAYDILLDEDEYLGDEYLILIGTLQDGNLIMLRYAMANMDLSIQIFDETMIIVAIFVFLVAFLLVEIFTRRLTKPVMELTDISKKMSELDFGVKYEPREIRSEIDILGEHMNSMSSTLRDTYVKLQKANIELKKDIELREKNEQMRTEFLSGVAHELKTPIALIQGYAEGLSDGMADDPESRDYYVDVIVDESAKMNKMVSQLISLNELEYGVDMKSQEEFNITEMIRGLVDSSKILLEQNDIKVEYNIDEDINVVSIPNLVEMAFSNYLSNAIHYCKDDKIIKISQLDKGDRVCISVFNTGDNIPEESLSRLWEKFYKVDKARTREYGGSGIGLSVVKLAIDGVKGKYGVYNTNLGVTFWFEIDKNT